MRSSRDFRSSALSILLDFRYSLSDNKSQLHVLWCWFCIRHPSSFFDNAECFCMNLLWAAIKTIDIWIWLELTYDLQFGGAVQLCRELGLLLAEQMLAGLFFRLSQQVTFLFWRPAHVQLRHLPIFHRQWLLFSHCRYLTGRLSLHLAEFSVAPLVHVTFRTL